MALTRFSDAFRPHNESDTSSLTYVTLAMSALSLAEEAERENELVEEMNDLCLLGDAVEADTLLVSMQRVSGRRRLDDYFTALAIANRGSFEMSERQTEILVDCYLVASLQRMFGDELVDEIDYVLERFKLRELFEEVIVMMKRRGGKTVVTATHAAIWIVTQPDANTNVYSKSRRVSNLIRKLIREIAITLIESGCFGDAEIVVDNEETLAIRTKYKTINYCNCYPCNEDVRPPLYCRVVPWVAAPAPCVCCN